MGIVIASIIVVFYLIFSQPTPQERMEAKKKRPVEFVVNREMKPHEERKDLDRKDWLIVTKKKGLFHQWGSEIEEGENEVATLSVAIIEDENGQIHTPTPSDVKFLDK